MVLLERHEVQNGEAPVAGRVLLERCGERPGAGLGHPIRHVGARGVAERLRRDVEKQVVTYKDNEVQVTVTIGVASYQKGMQLADLFEQADRNLYIGKRNGKNMVVS
jgi:GGDEF domain-containing protein